MMVEPLKNLERMNLEMTKKEFEKRKSELKERLNNAKDEELEEIRKEVEELEKVEITEEIETPEKVEEEKEKLDERSLIKGAVDRLEERKMDLSKAKTIEKPGINKEERKMDEENKVIENAAKELRAGNVVKFSMKNKEERSVMVSGGTLLVPGKTKTQIAESFDRPSAMADKLNTVPLNQMINLISQTKNIVNKQEFKEVVFKREKEGTTGIGEGIAIPHGKSRVVKKTCLAAMVLPKGVEFEALDKKKVNLIFLIAAPENQENTHLEVLSLSFGLILLLC